MPVFSCVKSWWGELAKRSKITIASVIASVLIGLPMCAYYSLLCYRELKSMNPEIVQLSATSSTYYHPPVEKLQQQSQEEFKKLPYHTTIAVPNFTSLPLSGVAVRAPYSGFVSVTTSHNMTTTLQTFFGTVDIGTIPPQQHCMIEIYHKEVPKEGDEYTISTQETGVTKIPFPTELPKTYVMEFWIVTSVLTLLVTFLVVRWIVKGWFKRQEQAAAPMRVTYLTEPMEVLAGR